MPRYKAEIPHDFGREEATERFKVFFEKARGFSDLHGSWNDHTFTFSVTAQGIPLKGTLQIDEDCFKQDINLPFIAMPFAGWTGRFLKQALTKQIIADKDPKHANANTYDQDESGAGTRPDVPIVLFLHIPKAGGTTMGEYIYNQCRTEKDNDEGLINAGVLFLPYGFFKEADLSVPEYIRTALRRDDLRAVVGHFWFGLHEHLDRPVAYVTLLRDPVDRIISLYSYLKLEDKMSLEQFASSPPFKEADNDQTRRLAGVDPEVGGCTREHLRIAQANLRNHFSVVGITERLDETLILLKRKLGWTKEIASYPKNVNPNKPLATSLSPEITREIRKRNELDHELYRYAIELMDKAITAEGPAFFEELQEYRKIVSAVYALPHSS